MIHYWTELALWMGGLFLVGCALGAAARGLFGGAAETGRSSGADLSDGT